MSQLQGQKNSISEWTLKKILIRLIAYPFCLSLIILGVYMIIELVNGRTRGAGIGAIVAAITYLWIDIKIIYKKNKERKHNNMQ